MCHPAACKDNSGCIWKNKTYVTWHFNSVADKGQEKKITEIVPKFRDKK